MTSPATISLVIRSCPTSRPPSSLSDALQTGEKTATDRRVFLSPKLMVAASLLLASPLKADYHLTFDDEFNTYNSKRWQTSDFWGMRNNPGDYQGQWFCDPSYIPKDPAKKPYNPFLCKNGILSIRAEPTPNNAYAGAPPNSKDQPYVAGQLTSAHKFTQRYGYFELRAKLPPGKGLWSRYWLLTDDGIWPGEYDVFEVLGKENPVTVHQTTHYRDSISKHGIDGNAYEGINPVDGKYHTYGFLWEPKSVTWYVDGVATLKQDNRINIPMYVLLDLVVGKDPGNTWPGNPDESNTWPADLEMDYFRVYSNDPSIPSVVPDEGYTPSILPEGLKVETTPTTAQLPTDWTAGDIGSPEMKGSSNWNPITGEWMIKSSAFGAQRQFAGKPQSGDGGIIATVQTTTAINSNDVSSGVMIRENTTTNSPEISLLHTTSLRHPNRMQSLVLKSRSSTGSEMETLATIPDVQLPVTLILNRSGKTITGAYSLDGGTNWKVIGTPQTFSLPEKVVAGIAVMGNQGNYNRLSRSTFSNVTVGGAAPTLTAAATSVATGETLAFTPLLFEQSTGTRISTGPVTWSVAEGGGKIDNSGIYTAPALRGAGMATIKAVFGSYSVAHTIAITLPSSWTLPSLVHTPPGDAGCAAGVWTVVGGGKGISIDNNHDTFRFVSSPVSGNHTVTVKLLSAGGTQAGLVIRDSAKAPDVFAGARGRYAGIWVTPTGFQFAARESEGKKAISAAQIPAPPTPVWLRLTRSGSASDVFTALYSVDGVAWTQLGNPRTFSLSDTAQVGFAIANGSPKTVVNATFSDLSVTSDKTPSPAPAP
jgi:beta-glucanase (GH16 family)/regulation of enolase protein 1 (concanavalin A-like superfamily)